MNDFMTFIDGLDVPVIFWTISSIFVFLFCVLSAGVLIPQILLISFQRKLFDVPDERKIHQGVVPRLGGIAFKPCPLIRFGGTVGPFPYESGVVSLFKLVRAEIVQQVQTVIGKVGLTLVFLLVVHYFGFSGLIINGIIGWKKEEKGTRYPSECHH